MESTRLPGERYVDVDVELDVEFEAIVAEWNAQREAEAAERTEVDDQLDALLETRAVMAAMQARSSASRDWANSPWMRPARARVARPAKWRGGPWRQKSPSPQDSPTAPCRR